MAKTLTLDKYARDSKPWRILAQFKFGRRTDLIHA